MTTPEVTTPEVTSPVIEALDLITNLSPSFDPEPLETSIKIELTQTTTFTTYDLGTLVDFENDPITVEFDPTESFLTPEYDAASGNIKLSFDPKLASAGSYSVSFTVE